MNPSPDSNLQAVRTALTLLEIAHEIDDNGNVVFQIAVDGGKEIEAVIFGKVLAAGFFDAFIFQFK